MGMGVPVRRPDLHENLLARKKIGKHPALILRGAHYRLKVAGQKPDLM